MRGSPTHPRQLAPGLLPGGVRSPQHVTCELSYRGSTSKNSSTRHCVFNFQLWTLKISSGSTWTIGVTDGAAIFSQIRVPPGADWSLNCLYANWEVNRFPLYWNTSFPQPLHLFFVSAQLFVLFILYNIMLFFVTVIGKEEPLDLLILYLTLRCKKDKKCCLKCLALRASTGILSIASATHTALKLFLAMKFCCCNEVLPL